MSTIAATIDPYRTHIGLSPTLQRPTLVLNRNWQPINVATVARALIMLWNDSAKIVDRSITSCTTGAIGAEWYQIATSRSSSRYASVSAFGGHCIDQVRCNADAEGYVQPQKRIQA